MAYEHKEGRGTIFPNDYKVQENHPDFRGKAMWKGEIVEISMWKGETQNGAEKFSIQIKEPRAKAPASSGAAKRPAASSKAEAEEPIPF
jgi:uncharacterized protein (DUF736 family)